MFIFVCLNSFFMNVVSFPTHANVIHFYLLSVTSMCVHVILVLIFFFSILLKV
jgi:hypothetical protein